MHNLSQAETVANFGEIRESLYRLDLENSDQKGAILVSVPCFDNNRIRFKGLVHKIFKSKPC